jgi:hypothetical protein
MSRCNIILILTTSVRSEHHRSHHGSVVFIIWWIWTIQCPYEFLLQVVDDDVLEVVDVLLIRQKLRAFVEGETKPPFSNSGIVRPPPPNTQYVNVAENISSSIDNVQCTTMIIIISSASISSSVDIVITGNPVARYVVGGHTGLPEYHPHVDRHTDAVRGGGGGKNWNSTSPGLSAKFR